MSADDLSQILIPPARRTLSDEVVERIRSAILTGELEPGEQLSEGTLADLLGVSRGPIREAVKRLEREGLVIVGTNRRAFVARLSREDFEEVYMLRDVLERVAIETACQRASEEDLAAMAAIIGAMAERIDAGGISEQDAARLDTEFHDVIFECTGMERLIAFWRILRPQVHVFLLSRNVADPDFRGSAVAGHQLILDAIAARNASEAKQLLSDHLRYGYERTLTTYEHVSS